MSGSHARSRGLPLLVLLVISLGIFLTYWNVGLNDDEGYLIGGVTRILDGQVPYRDFHHTYAPGRFYLIAGLFRLFGEDLLVVRALWVVIRVAIVLLAYVLGRRFLSTSGALAFAAIWIAVPGPWHKSFFHFFLMLDMLVITAAAMHPTRKSVAVAGAVAGLSLLFRQDLGLFALAIWIVMTALTFRTRVTPRDLVRFFFWFVLPVLPVAIYFASQGALSDAAHKIFLAGMRDNQTNALPFPALLMMPQWDAAGMSLAALRIFYYIPIAAVALAAGRGLLGLVRNDDTIIPVLPVIGFSILAFNQTIWRSDFAHLIQSMPPALLLLLWQCETSWSGNKIARHAGWLVPLALFALFFEYARVYHAPYGPARIASEGIQPIPPYYAGHVAEAFRPGEPLRLPKARVRVGENEARFLYAVGRAVEERSAPGDYILTVPGYQLFYFLFERKNPTEYIHLRRALDSPEEEDRYIRDILDHPTRLVFLRDIAIDGREERMFSRFAERPYQAIRNAFTETTRIGDLIVYARNED